MHGYMNELQRRAAEKELAERRRLRRETLHELNVRIGQEQARDYESVTRIIDRMMVENMEKVA